MFIRREFILDNLAAFPQFEPLETPRSTRCNDGPRLVRAKLEGRRITVTFPNIVLNMP